MRFERIRIRRIRGAQDFPVTAIELSLAQYVHSFNAGNQDACATEDLEPEHQPYDSLDRPVILLDYIVQILSLPQSNVAVMLGVVALYRRRAGTVLIDGYPVSGLPFNAMASSRRRRGQHRYNLDDPAMNRRVVHGHATLRHHLFKVAQATTCQRTQMSVTPSG